MIRFINCVRRRQDISLQEFRRHWNSPEIEALYDLAWDVAERTDRINDHPAEARRLEARAQHFCEELANNIRPHGRLAGN